jgi:hypothetical protein
MTRRTSDSRPQIDAGYTSTQGNICRGSTVVVKVLKGLGAGGRRMGGYLGGVNEDSVAGHCVYMTPLSRK